jgi:iron(III) transport system substrate-binding protein
VGERVRRAGNGERIHRDGNGERIHRDGNGERIHRAGNGGWARHAAPAAAVLAVLCVAGCGGVGGRTIVLYNGQHPQLTSALVGAFERESGIRVQVRANDSIVLADQILQEGGASAADVYLSENSPELTTLEQHGALAKLPPSTLAQIPRGYSSPGGEWVGVGLRVGGLVYAPARLSAPQLPRSVLALALPRWKGRVGVAPTDSDFVPLVGAVVATYGSAAAARWLSGLKRNAKLYETDESVVAAVNRGDVASGLVNNYYWYRLRLEQGAGGMHSAVYYFPNHDVGSVENVSGAAVLAASAHRAGAEAFVRFLVGASAQRILAAGDDYEYPARAGVAPNAALPALRAVAPDALGVRALGNDQQAAALIRRSGLV